MKNILTVFKKEMLRVLKDKRLIFTLILPGILIYLIYSLMGGALSGADQKSREAEYKVVAVNLSADVKGIMEELGISAAYVEFTVADQDLSAFAGEKKEMLKTGEADIILIFDNGFDTIIGSDSGEKPKVSIYYNPSEATSVYAYNNISDALKKYNDAVLERRGQDAEVYASSIATVVDEKAASAKTFAMLIPVLIITFLFSGCMAVTPDSIAGEKERGTIATILITPIKRSELALGKIFALTVLACISALSSFLGLMFSLPKLMGTGGGIAGLYGFGEYALILLVLLSTVLLIVGVMSILSSFAKSVKEANMLILPFMLVSMVISLMTMVSSKASASLFIYLIPIYNSVQSIVSILTFNVNIWHLAATVLSNICYLGLCIFALTKLFNNEKIMFSK